MGGAPVGAEGLAVSAGSVSQSSSSDMSDSPIVSASCVVLLFAAAFAAEPLLAGRFSAKSCRWITAYGVLEAASLLYAVQTLLTDRSRPARAFWRPPKLCLASCTAAGWCNVKFCCPSGASGHVLVPLKPRQESLLQARRGCPHFQT